MGRWGSAAPRRYVNGDLKLLAARLKIPIQKPFEKLSKKAQEALSEGLIAALDQYYEQEDVSEGTREWLLQYQSACGLSGLPGQAVEAVESGGESERRRDRGADGAVGDAGA